MGDMLDGREPSVPLSETFTDKQDIERPLRTIYWYLHGVSHMDELMGRWRAGTKWT